MTHGKKLVGAAWEFYLILIPHYVDYSSQMWHLVVW